ncbi:MAG: hypothetical protein ACXABY_27675 [Candidatus Thorarchaeota archaeon]|jgi:hypothetical protein
MLRTILDNRMVPPVGSLIKTKDGKHNLLLYVQEEGQLRKLAVCYAGSKKQFSYHVMPDIAGDNYMLKEFESTRVGIDPGFFKTMDSNMLVNLNLFKKNPEYPREDTVAIIGGGEIRKEEIDLLVEKKIPMIAVNNGINQCEPKYWVGIDCRSNLLDYVRDRDVSKVRAFIYAGVHPSVGMMKWKDVGWFTTLGSERKKGIPQQFDTEGVIGQALQFAYRGLKAKKIIMLGVQHPNKAGLEYFWIGLVIQAICFWYSRRGVVIWNCTEESTLVSGVVIGPLEAALATPVAKMVKRGGAHGIQERSKELHGGHEEPVGGTERDHSGTEGREQAVG